MVDNKEILEAVSDINIKLDELEANMNKRFDRIKDAIIAYLKLGNEFALGSAITSLKNI